MEEMLELLGVDPEEWGDDGYGPFDSNLIHQPCGTMIEPDAKECPQCHVANPLRGVLY